MNCDECGQGLSNLPYACNGCGESFCSEHRLPEKHDCIYLKLDKAERQIKRSEGEHVPWFDDKSESSEGESRSARISRSISETGKTRGKITTDDVDDESDSSIKETTTVEEQYPERTKERQTERKTRREELEEEQKERYSSPDVNLDGSLPEANYEEDIESLSPSGEQTEDGRGRNRAWIAVIVVAIVLAVMVAVLLL